MAEIQPKVSSDAAGLYTFETEIDIDAPVEEVHRHLTEPAALTAWMGQHATLEPQPGGRFELDINGIPVRGEYVAVEPGRIVVTWGMPGNADLPAGSTEVEFMLEPTATGTHLRLAHRKLPESQAPDHGTGWSHFLPRLAARAAGADPGPDPWAEKEE